MVGNQTPCLDCGALLVEWGEGRCIACDLRMMLLKDCHRLLELAVEDEACFHSAG